MIALSCVLLALASGAVPAPDTACPMDSLTVTRGSVSFAGFQVGEPVGEIEKNLGRALELQAEEGFPNKSATVVIAGHPVSLSFRQLDGGWVLSTISLRRAASDSPSCWSRDSVVAAVKLKAPKSRYVPSRHAPEQPEAANEYPMYSLDSGKEVVVLLKPAQGSVWVGRLEDFD